MKLITIIILSSIFFVSCGKPNKNHSELKADPMSSFFICKNFINTELELNLDRNTVSIKEQGRNKISTQLEEIETNIYKRIGGGSRIKIDRLEGKIKLMSSGYINGRIKWSPMMTWDIYRDCN